jgi:hypothetical protein
MRQFNAIYFSVGFQFYLWAYTTRLANMTVKHSPKQKINKPTIYLNKQITMWANKYHLKLISSKIDVTWLM